jgi:alkanesulfonate monooxygenase SsuD/methylene tetrahydromethanopterin reductase-like flavin-dependent oxidoreductase (luciferase family)
MKFMYFFLPTIPATMEERKRLRPIAHHPERWQRMIEEVVEIAQFAEEVGFDAVCFPEHHLHSEGIEMGSLPVLTQHVIHHTKRIRSALSAMCCPDGTRCGSRWKSHGSTS